MLLIKLRGEINMSLSNTISLDYGEKIHSIKVTDDWFFDQIRSRINEDDFENFIHKDITLDNLYKDSKYIEKSMLQNSSSTTTTDSNLDLEYATSCIHAIVELYNKFGKCLYEYNKDFLLRDIQILTEELNYDQIEDTIQELPSFNAYATVMRIYKMDSKDFHIFMEIDNYFHFIIEDEDEGIKALEHKWRNFKLWKLYRRLEKQGKIPVYKDAEIEKYLWIAKSDSDWFYTYLDKVKSITPLDETIARNISHGYGSGSGILLSFHTRGVFTTATIFYVPENLQKGNVPKRVLTELFKNGLQLNTYIRHIMQVTTKNYPNKPYWWYRDTRAFNIPVVWHDYVMVEWMLQKLKTSFTAMVKPRIYYMHGIKIQYTYFSKLDEIQPEDLVNGINTKPDVAFAHSAERIRKARMEEEIMLPVAPFKETESVKQLKYSANFIEEGRFMHNCIAEYIDSARKEHCYIYHIESNNQYGTMEVDKEGNVVQLYGMDNDDPMPDVMYAVAEWLRINNLEIPEIVEDWRDSMEDYQIAYFDDVYSL